MPLPLVSQGDVWAPNPAAMEISNNTRASFMNPPTGMASSQYNVFDVGRWGRSYVENRVGKKHNVRVRKLANETLAAEEAEADEREAEHRHGGGFGNVIFRSVGRDSAARAGAGASAGVVDDG